MCLSALSNRQLTTSNPATGGLQYCTRQARWKYQNDGANVVRAYRTGHDAIDPDSDCCAAF